MGARQITIEELNDRIPEQSRLKALEYLPESHVSPSGIKRRRVNCLCECGENHICVVSDLLRGNPLSCGCRKRGRKSIYRYGDAALYKRWYDMRNRCHNEKASNYKQYGAKGVRVCKEWVNDYEAFAKWSLDNGYSPELQLDKDIKGNGKIYSPKTCAWVTALEHSSYKKTAVRYEYNGELLTIPEISRKTGHLQAVLKAAVKAGKTIEQAIGPKTPKFKRY